MATSSFYTPFVIKDEKTAEILARGLESKERVPLPEDDGEIERGREALKRLVLACEKRKGPSPRNPLELR